MLSACPFQGYHASHAVEDPLLYRASIRFVNARLQLLDAIASSQLIENSAHNCRVRPVHSIPFPLQVLRRPTHRCTCLLKSLLMLSLRIKGSARLLSSSVKPVRTAMCFSQASKSFSCFSFSYHSLEGLLRSLSDGLSTATSRKPKFSWRGCGEICYFGE
jgi:hypothetical protein